MSELVTLQGVSKFYGPVRALQDVSFSIAAGEVHALLGENGAGKSTTMRIVKGETAPSSGQVLVDGKPLTRFAPSVSDGLGIAMVHQELSVFDGLTVAENIAPDLPARTGLGIVDHRRLNALARDRLQLFGLDIAPEQVMGELTTGQKQIVEILRTLTDDRRLIILDEPTSSLNANETRTLLDLVKRLRAEGRSVLFVSHRIPEVLEISDRITVLRDGHFIETLVNRGLCEDDLVRRMVGREMKELHSHRPVVDHSGAPVVFEARNLKGVGGLSDVSLEVRAGEVLGVFGLEGSGAAELSGLLFGLDEKLSGEIAVKGEPVGRCDPRSMIRRGVTYLSPDRSHSGLFMDRPLPDSIVAPVLDRVRRFGMVDRRKVAALSRDFADRFSIKSGGLDALPSSLSGGNQQKVMMAACLTPNPSVLIVNEPTRGVDVGAKAEMHRKLLEIASEGAAVIVFSAELSELVALCDRVLVLSANRVSGELRGQDITEDSAMALAAGSLAH